MQPAERTGRARRAAQVLGALLAAFLVQLPSQAQTAYGAPSAQAARQAGGIVEGWQHLLQEARGLGETEKVEAVNRFFNRVIAYEPDAPGSAQGDHWSTPMELMQSGRGDCEDFAIAKYVTLQMLGVPGERLRLMYVHVNAGAGRPAAHMVLGFHPEATAEPLVLDNMVDSVRAASQRPDLSLVYSFNALGLWIGNARRSAADPLARMSRWRDVQQRMRAEGTPDPLLASRGDQLAAADASAARE